MTNNLTRAVGQKTGLHQNYNFIDVVKLVCAALVVAIHVPPLTSVNWVLNFAVVNFISRIAVPYFFVSSAYFVFKKAYNTPDGNLDRSVIFAYVKKILRLYIIWSVIYAPFEYRNLLELSGGATVLQFLKYYIIKFIFSASYGHLWYLNAVIVAYILLFLMLAADIKPAFIACFSLLMYCIGLCAQSWFGFIEPLRQYPRLWSVLILPGKIFTTSRNGLCEGLLFVVIGRFFAVYDIRMKLKTAVICFAGSFMLFAAEVFTLFRLAWIREYDMFFGIVPTVFFLFYISLNISLPNKKIYRKMRILSALVYFSHMIFVEILMLIPALQAMPGGGLTRYAFTLLFSLALSAGIVKLSGRFKLLNYLYR